MSDEIHVNDVFDAILELWAAWGSSYPRESELLVNADEMRIDLTMSLTLSLLELAQRSNSPEFSRAIQVAVSGMSDAYDLRGDAVDGSSPLDSARIESCRRQLGFE